MTDYIIDDASLHYAASKSAKYRQFVTERFSVFVKFLQDNDLTTTTLLDAGEMPSEDLKIMKSDLTEDGFEVVKSAYDKWLRGIDNGNPIDDTRTLEKSLAKVRRK